MKENNSKLGVNDFDMIIPDTPNNFKNLSLNINKNNLLDQNHIIINDNIQNNQINNNSENNLKEKNIINVNCNENNDNINQEFSKYNENINNENQFHTGRWAEDEHQKFIDGILQYGNEWKKVQQIIKTRSSTQARSHAQKFFQRIKKIIKSKEGDFNDKDKIVEIIVNNILPNKKGSPLTKIQKEKLLIAIYSNIKNDEENNEHIDKNEELGLEENNLKFKKENNDNNILPKTYKSSVNLVNVNLNNIFEFGKIGQKRKLSKNFDVKDRIFNIKKDMSHRPSMDISFPKLSNNEEIKDNLADNTKNNINNNLNQDINKNSYNVNNNLNYINNNSEQNNLDNCEMNNKNNFIIHNYINITNNYMSNNYFYNMNNPEFINNNINNMMMGSNIQDSYNLNYDKNDSYSNEKYNNYYGNCQYFNKNNYNFDRNLMNVQSYNNYNYKFNNYNDYDSSNNNQNDPFKLEFGCYPDKNNNYECEQQMTINEEEDEFIKMNNNNEDNPSYN